MAELLSFRVASAMSLVLALSNPLRLRHCYLNSPDDAHTAGHELLRTHLTNSHSTRTVTTLWAVRFTFDRLLPLVNNRLFASPPACSPVDVHSVRLQDRQLCSKSPSDPREQHTAEPNRIRLQIRAATETQPRMVLLYTHCLIISVESVVRVATRSSYSPAS